MSLARIRTDQRADAEHLADALRRRGYQIEIVAPGERCSTPAELELRLERCPTSRAIAKARDIAQGNDCDVILARGAIGKPTAAAPRISAPVIETAPKPMEKPADPAPRIEEPKAEKREEPTILICDTNASEFEATLRAPTFVLAWLRKAKEEDYPQKLLDAGAIAMARMQTAVEQVPELWRNACERATVVAGKLHVASLAARAGAQKRWQVAAQHYAAVRAVAIAKAEESRARREGRRILVQHAAAVMQTADAVATTDHPSKSWRAALTGAAIAALVIGIGFGLGARRTPAIVPAAVSSPQAMPVAAALPAAIANAPVATPAPTRKTERPNASAPSRRAASNDASSDSDQEVIVRHFAPVRSAPAVSKDGVKHYSDDQ